METEVRAVASRMRGQGWTEEELDELAELFRMEEIRPDALARVYTLWKKRHPQVARKYFEESDGKIGQASDDE